MQMGQVPLEFDAGVAAVGRAEEDSSSPRSERAPSALTAPPRLATRTSTSSPDDESGRNKSTARIVVIMAMAG